MEKPTFDLNKALGAYLLGAAIVWAGIFLATAIVLEGTDKFGALVPILAGGAVWFIILVPTLFRPRA